jgi:ABC-type branched-subunit amino acid transport system ATPase component
MTRALLTVEGLHCGYGADEIIHGIDMTIAAGEVITILGPNGCGKSTFVKAILGYVRISSGGVRFLGRDLVGMGAQSIAMLGVGYVPQLDNVFKPMTVRENLEMGGYRLERARLRAAIERIFEAFPALAERPAQIAGTLSGGERQLLAMARALMVAPKLLVLDEPSAGLSPIKIGEVFDNIAKIVELGTAVVLIEQDVLSALSVSTRGYVFAAGKVVFSGSADLIMQDARMREAYLGVGGAQLARH